MHFAPVAFALAVQRLMLAELLKQDHGQQVWSGTRGVTWNGAGGCVIFSHYRNQPLQVEISSTKYDTFKKAGKIPSTTTGV